MKRNVASFFNKIKHKVANAFGRITPGAQILKQNPEPNFNKKNLLSLKQGSYKGTSNSSDLVGVLNKFVLGLVVTPFVVVTGVLTKTTVLIFTNIALSLAHLLDLVLKVYNSEITLLELLLIIIGIIILTVIILMAMPQITIVSHLFATLFYANIVASAINLFVGVKELFIPLMRELIEFINKNLKYIPLISKNKTIRQYIESKQRLFFVFSEVNYETDSVLIELLSDNFKFTKNNKPDIDKINAFLRKMYEILYKKQYSFLGFFRNAADIKVVNGFIYNTQRLGNAKNAIDFLTIKLKRKEKKLKKVGEFIDHLKTPQDCDASCLQDVDDPSFNLIDKHANLSDDTKDRSKAQLHRDILRLFSQDPKMGKYGIDQYDKELYLIPLREYQEKLDMDIKSLKLCLPG